MRTKTLNANHKKEAALSGGFFLRCEKGSGLVLLKVDQKGGGEDKEHARHAVERHRFAQEEQTRNGGVYAAGVVDDTHLTRLRHLIGLGQGDLATRIAGCKLGVASKAVLPIIGCTLLAIWLGIIFPDLFLSLPKLMMPGTFS